MKIENLKLKIVFLGADKFVLPILQKLQHHYDIPLVLTTEHYETDPVSSYCKTQNIPYLAVQQFNNETIEQLSNTHTDVAVLAYFGMILPQSVLNIFPKGIINVHPSLLPKFRGPTPVQSAMMAGEQKTGVSIIRLDNDVDHGPLLAQESEPILETDTD
jgi:methionyl-tRNA formyltransferase